MLESRKKWDKENKWIFSIGFMRRTEADMIAFLQSKEKEGIPRSTVIKQALRNMMEDEGYREE